MKKILIIFLMLAALLLREECHGQGTVKYTAGISYGTGAPTYSPTGNVSKKYINLTTLRSYTYSGTAWVIDGQGIDVVSGCAAPAYTPGLGQSNIVINNCTLLQNGQGPELYYYTGSSWIFINEKSTAPTYTAGTGIDITGTVISNTGDLSNTNELQSISLAGQTLTLSGGGGSVTIPKGGGVYTGGEGIVVDSPQIRIDTLDRLSFATSPTLPGGVGTIRWNDSDGTLEFGMKGGNVTQQVGQELTVLVKHADNSGLANGAVVYVVGSDGANKTVRLAKADAESTSANTFGVMSESATGGAKAFCTTFGLVRDINTASLTEGQMVWVSSATAGAMTTTRPTAPNHAVQVGFCIRSHATQGVIFVSVQNGYELGELHDVTITSPSTGQVLKYDTDKWVNGTAPASTLNDLTDVTLSSPTNNQILQYNTAGSQWVNATLSAITGSGINGYLSRFSGAGTLDTANIYISGANVGIRTNTPTSTLTVVSPNNVISTNGVFGLSNSSGTNIFKALANGNVGIGLDPSYKLDILGGLRLGSSTVKFAFGESGGNSVFLGSITNHPYYFVVNTNEVARFTTGLQFALGTSSPNARAKLDVTSTTQGVLFPRMTGTQRDAIAAPPDGLVLYNTTANKLQVRAASAWVDLH